MLLRVVFACLTTLLIVATSACEEPTPDEGNACYEPGATTTDPEGNELVCR
ncbi:hypothetical protein [Streptomyces buecherae]|uniref:Lipoprotein n=1 Tax=Streptomyces buecherae TaxID=2763006 RepID=A0A7H8NFG2_9ACTN|nr:hypothetical protein [Streptomyces buecherae]QKW53200.1 hypothetical protein HUT08_30795 [Streptomyces buecherae]